MVLQTGFKTCTRIIHSAMAAKVSGAVRETVSLVNGGAVENVVGDVYSFSRSSKVLETIRELITTHAPLDRQEALISKFNKYAQDESGLTVIESLMEGINKCAPDVQGEKLIKNYNRCFNKLVDLQKNNPEEFQLMVDGGFFDLVRQGKIHPQNFDIDMTNARISRSLLADLRKAKNGEDFVPDLSKHSFEEIRSFVNNGDTYLKDGKVYVSTGGYEKEIHLSKDKLLELFPPVLRNISNQGAIGDCWLVGRLDNMISTESGRIGIYKLFRQSGDDIFIRFPNCDKEILFPGGRVLQTKKKMKSVPGIEMLEQALAIHLGNKYTSNVTNIEEFSANVDKLMKILEAGKGRLRKNDSEVLNLIANETIDCIYIKSPYNVYSRKPSFITFLEEVFGIGRSTIDNNRMIMQNLIESQANNNNLKIGLSFINKLPQEYSDSYNMVSHHQLTLKEIVGNTCYISNPWYNWIEKGVNKDLLLSNVEVMHVPFVWG